MAAADATVKSRDVEAQNVAIKAAADAQQLRELQDRVTSLTGQLTSTTEQLRAAESGIRWVQQKPRSVQTLLCDSVAL